LAELGVDEVEFWGEPDGSAPHSDALVGRMAETMRAVSPDWTFAPWLGDAHRDHVAVALLARAAWEAAGRPGGAFWYEVGCPVPATFIVEIGLALGAKTRACNHYQLAGRYVNYQQGWWGLAAFRGMYLCGGGQGPAYCEAFVELGDDALFAHALDGRR